MSFRGRSLALLSLIGIAALIVAWTVAIGATASGGDESGTISHFVIAGEPPAMGMEAVVEPESSIQMGTNVLPDVPAFSWSYGCAATSAAMLFGYYDRIGYENMYAGSTDDGVCPLDNSLWGTGIGGSMGECPLSATHVGIDGRSTKGHVDDYWVYSGSKAEDPFITYEWTEHVQDDCTGDFMGTNQSELGNIDGATYFYYYTSGDPLYDYVSANDSTRDGCHGLRLFAESRGYEVRENFTQLIEGEGKDPTKGFTFDDFMNEIDCGRPVLIHLINHTVLGYGYSSGSSTVYIHDTWDHETHTMTWGGTYDGASQWGVSVIRLSPVLTGEASEVSAYSATLNGVLASLEGETCVEASFEYGTVPGSYTGTTATQMLWAPGEFGVDVSGLSGATTYYYRARVFDGAYSYGSEADFTTSTVPPEVTTDNVSLVSTNSARLNGTLTSPGTANSVEMYFEWGTAPASYSSNTTSVIMTHSGTFSVDLAGLTPGTSYYLRAVADGHGTGLGEEMSFTTKTLPPVVFTLEASNVSTDSGTLNGRLVSLGTASEVEVFFEWGTAPGAYTDNSTPEILDTKGYFSFEVGGYAPGTTCYFRAWAIGHGADGGDEEDFTTATIRPSVSTIGASEVGTRTATVGGSLLSLGTASNVTVTLQFGTIPGVYWFETSPQVMGEAEDWSAGLEGLTPGINYYFRAKAVGHGTAYGAEMMFTTGTMPPTIGSQEASEIGPNTAILYAELSDLGTIGTVQVSFEYGTMPDSYEWETAPQVKTEAGAVLIDLVDLTPGTTYYFRAKAAGHGTVWGTEESFSTITVPPAAATSDASLVSAYAAKLCGEVVSLGSADRLDVHFEWGTTTGEYSNESEEILVTEPGTVTADLSGLSPGTTYYFRIKASGHGMECGEEKMFITSTIPPSLGSVGEAEAFSLAASSANVTGELISLGTASSVVVSVELATVPDGPYRTAGTEVMTAPGTFAFELPDLDMGQTYYLRIKADGGSHGLTYAREILLVIPNTRLDWALLGSAIAGSVLLLLVLLLFVRAIAGRRI